MKIVYLMHIEWNWIKQRPHFIAENLVSKYGKNNVVIVYPYRWNRKGLQKRSSEDLFLTKIFIIPIISKFTFGKRINEKFKQKQIRRIIKNQQPNLLYICGYEMGEYIPETYNGKILYDCMDDMIAFPAFRNIKTEILKREKQLYDKSSIVLASSLSLKNKLTNRYGSKDIEIVRNGFKGEIISDDKRNNLRKTSNKFQLCYFGTIADWFDWDVIIKSLDDFSEIEYLLLGPIESGIVIPKHERIKYAGTIEHSQLYEVTKDSDCFIMPFKLNELILSVDPVKVYEYINFNRNILMIRYPEVERFDDFVSFYSSYEEYKNELRKLMNNPSVKYNSENRINFLKENGWYSRTKQIIDIIEKDKE